MAASSGETLGRVERDKDKRLSEVARKDRLSEGLGVVLARWVEDWDAFRRKRLMEPLKDEFMRGKPERGGGSGEKSAGLGGGL